LAILALVGGRSCVEAAVLGRGRLPGTGLRKAAADQVADCKVGHVPLRVVGLEAGVGDDRGRDQHT
jgi:hypothetical protein